MTNFTDENMGNSALRIHKSHWSIIWYPILHMLHHETHQLMNQKHIESMSRKQGITISCSWDCAVDLQICGPLKNAVGIFNGNWCFTIVAFCALYTFMCWISPLDHSQRNSEKANGPSLVYPVGLYNCKQTTKCWSDPQEWEISLSASNAIVSLFMH